MYAQYAYSAGQTQGGLLSDLIAILTGQTDVNALSAGCDKINSFITISWKTAGWSLHDALAGANAQCLKAPIADDAAKYKYCVIDVDTSGYIILKGYELWDVTNHVGTNMIYLSSSNSYAQRINLTSGGTLYIHSSDRHLHIHSYQSAVWGSSVNNGSSGIFERTRVSAWDTVANGYPPFVWSNLGLASTNQIQTGDYGWSTMNSPRIINNNAVEVTGGKAKGQIITPFGKPLGSQNLFLEHLGAFPNSTIPDANKQMSHLMIPFGVINPEYGFLGGDISGFADTYWTTYGYGGPLDEIIYNGNTYTIWPEYYPSYNYRIAVRKG